MKKIAKQSWLKINAPDTMKVKWFNMDIDHMVDKYCKIKLAIRKDYIMIDKIESDVVLMDVCKFIFGSILVGL